MGDHERRGSITTDHDDERKSITIEQDKSKSITIDEENRERRNSIYSEPDEWIASQKKVSFLPHSPLTLSFSTLALHLPLPPLTSLQ
jgi:hypothetical protein